MSNIIQQLEHTISNRMNSADAGASYVASLHAKGAAKIAQKVGEEGVECALACMSGDTRELISESADLVFHLLVALHHHGQSWQDVLNELSSREGISGIDEKNSRSS